MSLTGEQRRLPGFTSRHGHPYLARAEPAKGRRHGYCPLHHSTQYHSTLRHMIFRVEVYKLAKAKRQRSINKCRVMDETGQKKRHERQMKMSGSVY